MKAINTRKKILGLIMGFVLISAILITTLILSSSIFGASSATYSITNDWGSGATGNVTINNTGASSIEGWTVSWTYTNGQTISSLWGGDYNQSGSTITVTNPSWETTIAPDSSVSIGFIVNYSGSNPDPTNLTVTEGGTSSTSTSTNTVTPTTTTTASPTDTSTGNSDDSSWSSSDQWGLLDIDGYTIYNNIWGSGAGSQTVWANSYSNWGVWANHPNTGGIKSYPNCERQINIPLSQISSCSSTFSSTVPSSGSYTTAYDIWCGEYAHEIMLWMNWNGEVGPIASSYDANGAVADYTNVSVGGHTWNVYIGSNGSNMVYSFLRTNQTNSANINIKDVCNWLEDIGSFNSNIELDTVQLGWEITSSNGGLDFEMNNYSVSYN